MRHRPDDERGATLTICLVVVAVVGLIVSATLTLEDTTIRAQSAFVEKRKVDLAADAGIDTMIGTIRDDPEIGRFDHTLPVGQPCAKQPSLAYEDETLGGSVVVDCRVDNTLSGDFAAGHPFDDVIFTVGGHADDGGTATSPFCTDRHAPTACEAGVFVGRGNLHPDGIVVEPNGADPGNPLLRSNGALITRGPQNEVHVHGDVLARRACAAGLVVYGTRTCDAGGPLMPTPGYRHEWASPMTATRDPRTNRPIDPVTGGALPAETSDMPRRSVPPTSDCADGYVELHPGWYHSATDLNALMTACNNHVMYWFRPGVYYFDFVDGGDGGKWQEPPGFTQLVAGTPYASGENAWNPCTGYNSIATIGSCPQPPRRMTANRVNLEPSEWAASEADDEGLIGDGDELSAQLTDNRTRRVTWDRLLPPISNNARLSRVVVRVKHTIGPDEQYQDGFPQVEMNLPLPGWGRCVVDLSPAMPINTRTPVADNSRRAGDAVWLDADGAIRIELTGGCPTTEGGTQASAFPVSWTPALVNSVVVEYRTRRAANLRPPVAVDGADVIVEYTGPPSPTFPGGCDPTLAGVQFVFGNLSRMEWIANDEWVELCGRTGGARVDPRAIAVYGLSHERRATVDPDDPANRFVSLAPPWRYHSGHDDRGRGLAFAETSLSGPAFQYDAALARGLPRPVNVDWWEAADNHAGTLASTDAANPSLRVTVPGTAVPANSAIEHVEVRLRYAAGPGVDRVSLRVFPGSTTRPSSDLAGSVQMPSQHLGFVNTRSELGITGGAITLGAWPAGNDDARWRHVRSPTDDPTTPLPDDESVWTDIFGDDDTERVLTDALRTWNGVNGAQIELTFHSSTANRAIVLDAVELVVAYRPAGLPRPLRGCMTIRTSEIIPNDPARRADDEAAGRYAGTHGIHNGDPFRKHSEGPDQAYGSPTGAEDTNNCAMLAVFSDSSLAGGKLHIAGGVYAPTAAVEFRGMDNEAAFVTDGIVVRQLTVRRWRRGPAVTTFGGGTSPRRLNRRVTITARIDGRVVAIADVEFDDRGALVPADVGSEVTIHRWERRPAP